MTRDVCLRAWTATLARSSRLQAGRFLAETFEPRSPRRSPDGRPPGGDRVNAGDLVEDFVVSYTKSMKTAISLPDEVYRDAERLAKRLRKSRSRLYMEAVSEYVARHEPQAVTEALDRLVGQGDLRPEPLARVAAHRLLERTEW